MNIAGVSGRRRSRPQVIAKRTRAALVLAAGLLLGAVAQGAPLASSAQAASAGTEIRGVVTELDVPTRNVIVTAYLFDPKTGDYHFAHEAYTDANGSWTMGQLSDGEYTLKFDTSHSNARFALGETLGGSNSVKQEEPQFAISDGVATDEPFSDVGFTRLGGEVSLTVADDEGNPYIDLDDASAKLVGITRSGEDWESRRFWSDSEGDIVIPRVPTGGFVPSVSVAGSAFAAVSEGVVATRGAQAQMGVLTLPAPSEKHFDVSGELSIAGVLQSGEEVTAVLPQLSPEPETTQFAWVSNDGVISDANESAFALGEPQVGSPIEVWAFSFAADYEPAIAFAVTSEAVVALSETTPPTESPTDEEPTDAASDDEGVLPWTGATGVLLLLLIASLLLAAGLVLYRFRQSIFRR